MSKESLLSSIHTKSESIEKLISSLATTSFKLSTLIGGAIMLYYCFKIGYFPTDLSISDTFIFIALSILFGILYGITLLTIKILFNIIFSFLLYLNVKFFKFKELIVFSNLVYRKYKFSIDEIFGSIFVIIWLSFFLLMKIIKPLDVLSVLVIFFIAVCFYEVSIIKIKEKRLSNGLGIDDIEFIRKKEFLNITVFLLTIFLLLFSGMKAEGFVKSSMQILSLANDNVSVHIQKPYGQYLVEYGVPTINSNFGDDYVKSENVDVLMQGVGSNVVMNFAKNRENGEIEKVKIILPRDKIHIIDN